MNVLNTKLTELRNFCYIFFCVETYLSLFDLFHLGVFALIVLLNVHIIQIPESEMGNERRSDLLYYIVKEKNLKSKLCYIPS